MTRSPFGELPPDDDPGPLAGPEDGHWPGTQTWGGRGRLSVLVVLGVLAAVLVVVLALTFLSDDDPVAGTAAVGPSPVPTDVGLQPTTSTTAGGVRYEVGIGSFVPSTRGVTSPDSHLLAAPIVVRNPGSTPVPNPLAPRTQVFQVGVRPLAVAATGGAICQNTSPAAPPGQYRGLGDECVVFARATTTGGPAQPTIAPGGEARGTLLSLPVPDAVTDTAPSVWVAVAPGAWERLER